MAEIVKKLYIRPSADIYLGHEVVNSEYGYLAISEQIADGGTTYIHSSSLSISRFETKFDSTYSKKTVLTNAKICVHADNYGDLNTGESKNVFVNIFLGETSITDEHFNFASNDYKLGWVTVEKQSETLLNALKNYLDINGKLPDLTLELSSRGYSGGYKEESLDVAISQVYIEIECATSESIFLKKDSKYTNARRAYNKANGTWSEIPEDEAKAILTSNTIRRE